MKIYWGVIRIWYVSTTCKSNDILLQCYYMNGKGKSKVSIQFLPIFRQSGDVLFFLYARRLRGYTATAVALGVTLPLQKFWECFSKNDTGTLMHGGQNCIWIVRILVNNNGKKDCFFLVFSANGGLALFGRGTQKRNMPEMIASVWKFEVSVENVVWLLQSIHP